jgi:hypothetical protein
LDPAELVSSTGRRSNSKSRHYLLDGGFPDQKKCDAQNCDCHTLMYDRSASTIPTCYCWFRREDVLFTHLAGKPPLDVGAGIVDHYDLASDPFC